MRYWLSFGLLLGAALIVAVTLLWAVLGLPLLFVILVTVGGYGFLVALNLLPPGRPSYGRTSVRAAPTNPTRGLAHPLSDPNFVHHVPYDPTYYDAFEDAHAYWEDPYADDARIAATPIVLASIGLLAIAVLGIGAAAIQWGIGGGGGQPHPPVGAVLGENAPTQVSPVASATSTPTVTATAVRPATAAPTAPSTATPLPTATQVPATPTRTLPTQAPATATAKPPTSTAVPPTATRPRPTTPPTSAATSAATSGATAQSTSGATAQSTSTNSNQSPQSQGRGRAR